ncbi:hypothetical protein NHF50_08910 [Flavobacterium sp. NRK F10]|uniref:hypothetical protein n=1 Tax=Flavobacterium sp. NRK F10 TaxID=2954931 RepID=UPI002091CB55|nr:hypothetical protein [Flavobacterium sp. NRK F10]MCO6175167.1 hypothetical protein [Flavobacterium sp. NRK F10]
MIKENIGYFASVLFIIVFLSFISKNNEESNTVNVIHFENKNNFNKDKLFDKIVLEDYFTTKYTLNITYEKRNSKDNLPVSAYSMEEGLIAGTEWIQNDITIHKIDNTIFEVNVYGSIKWKLLNLKIYSQEKKFTKRITLN